MQTFKEGKNKLFFKNVFIWKISKEDVWNIGFGEEKIIYILQSGTIPN